MTNPRCTYLSRLWIRLALAIPALLSATLVFAEPTEPAQSAESTHATQPTQQQGSNMEPYLTTNKPKIAIVIDDLGYRKDVGDALVAMNHPITFAVIPNTPHAEGIIELAQLAEHEVILHIPMETLEPIAWEPGLSSDMARSEFKTALNTMINKYPYAKGINNHGGSKLTTDAERMAWVMETLLDQHMYFLDSKTIGASIAASTAQKFMVPNASRDIFLDHERNEAAVLEQLEKLKRHARRRGQAIAIGHPHPVTLKVLREQLALLENEGYELTYTSELIKPLMDPVLESQEYSAAIPKPGIPTALPN